MIIGSAFDSGKKYAYDKEIKYRVSFASDLPNIVKAIGSSYLGSD